VSNLPEIIILGKLSEFEPVLEDILQVLPVCRSSIKKLSRIKDNVRTKVFLLGEGIVEDFLRWCHTYPYPGDILSSTILCTGPSMDDTRKVK
jgi:hypothetical protein